MNDVPPEIKDRVIGEMGDYHPPSWDEWFMSKVYLVASKSKDHRTKIGSVLIKERRIISEGYNGICMDINDTVSERFERPEKYFWFEHSERNCVYSAARFGISTLGSILYTQGIPCCDCTRAVIQSGIKEVVVHKQWEEFEEFFTWEKWKDQAKRSVVMLDESNIKVRRLDKILNVTGYLDGKIIKC